ncbi:hypothetical protein GGI35DRAFT_437454 [Trichoderma velutinum]
MPIASNQSLFSNLKKHHQVPNNHPRNFTLQKLSKEIITNIMPRNGDGSSDNGPFPEADHNIGHGVTKEDKSKDKTAPLPEGRDEKGLAIEGMNASGGQSQGIKQGPNVGQGGRSSKN